MKNQQSIIRLAEFAEAHDFKAKSVYKFTFIIKSIY
jgi:hypothetical protein